MVPFRVLCTIRTRLRTCMLLVPLHVFVCPLLLRGHRVAVNKSWETLKRSPMPPFGRLVRCSAHGRSRDYGTAFAECRIAVQIGNRYIIIRQNPHNTWWICRPLTSLQLCTLNHTCGLLLNVVLPCYLPPIEQNVGRFKPQTRESGSCCAPSAPKITRDYILRII